MNRYIYLRVHGDEGTARAIQQEANRPATKVKELRALHPAGGRYWDWLTPEVEYRDIHDLDDRILGLLGEYRPLFDAIKKHLKPDTEVVLEIVTNCSKGDDVSGLFLSVETIRLLAELGASVDYDINQY